MAGLQRHLSAHQKTSHVSAESPMRQLVQRLIRLTTLVWILLAVSGVYLVFEYRPTASAAYQDMENLRDSVTLLRFVRSTHQWLSWLAVVLALALPIASLVQGTGLKRTLSAVAGLAVTVMAFGSGLFLPWDQIALWSVTAGTNMSGLGAVWGGNVRFVLIGGVEVSANTIRVWQVIHTIAVPVAALLIYLSDRRHRARKR